MSLRVRTCRYAIPELMFQPKSSAFGVSLPEELRDSGGLVEMISTSVSRCEPDVRMDLLGHVLLTGGNSLHAGLNERLEKDLKDKFAATSSKVKLHPAGGVVTGGVHSTTATPERKFSVWIGGSILASLGSFHQMWMSRVQYNENGKGLVHTQCP